ncbi:TolC family protein [Mucilaginibacter sp. BJC16-A38]|uniref:TolC family protein n=1 Tax=Mucilaginibacter phenanthrenivorans TaxID=1234842 RepID=UPI0021588E1C|nr:TolC family protein [Mucilaginibacter phenanthrenivorans]MCR8556313.1 TolC family protein [Mucilaginibacter phenanthrenivorans]
MPLKIRNIILVFLILTGFNAARAQDSTLIGKTLRWDLVKCIDYAKKNNIQINTLRLSQLTSQQEYLLAKAGRLPSLSGSASQNLEHINTNSRNNGSVSTVDSNGVVINNNKGSSFIASGSYSLNSTVTLYNGNFINNDISQKNLGVQAANLNIIQQENDITLQITQAYLTILLDKENVIYDKDLVTTTTAQVKLEQQRYDVGSVARAALIQLQAQQANDKYTLVNQQNTERGDLLTLKQLLLLPSDVDFDIIKPDTITPIDTITAFHDVEKVALTTRPEVKSGELSVKIAQYDVEKARAGYKPTLTAGGSLNTGYTSGQGNFGNQLNYNFNQQIGLNLAIPIFTKRVVKTQVEEAKINVEQSQLNLRNTKTTLSQTVERAFINVQNSKSQYDAALEQYKYSKESYRIASEQLKVGVANTVDFLLQKTLFVQAQQAFIQAKYNELLTLKIYDFYRGIPIKL